jgi:RNA polymerase sigma-70 factor, ECF subfamily
MKFLKPLLGNYSDEELMRLIADKNAKAFEELYKRYNKIILHYLYKMVGGCAEQAQDFLHDIFLKIIEKPYLFDRTKKFKTWIFQIAHNKCKNEYRKRATRNNVKAKYEMDELYTQNDVNPDTEIEYTQLNDFIHCELSKFKEEHFSTFLMRYQHEMSISEIAQILECPEGTVKSRLFYVTQKLVKKMKDHYID